MISKAQRRANRVFERAFAGWLSVLESSERLSRQIHNRIATRLARELRGASAATINRRIDRAFDAFERERVELIERAVMQGAERGSGLTPSVARAVFGDRDARRALAPLVDDPETIARRIAASRLNGDAVADGIAARARLRARTRETARRMTAEVRESIQLGEATTETAQRMLASTDIEVRLPRYIERVRALVRGAPPSAVQREVRRQLGALVDGRIQEHNIASETRRFLDRVQRNSGADIDQAVEQWVRGRAHNQAMTIARTEGQAALLDSYVESTREQEWVIGYRWNLSPAHPRADVCDVMASQNLYGLGGGGYPKDGIPSLAHPNDLCYFTAITDEHYLERELARRRGQPEPPRPWENEQVVTGRDWLARQSAERRTAILGPGRAREFERRPGRVVNSDGSLNPLYQIQGRPPPGPPSGERFVHRRDGRVTRRRSRAQS